MSRIDLVGMLACQEAAKIGAKNLQCKKQEKQNSDASEAHCLSFASDRNLQRYCGLTTVNEKLDMPVVGS